MAEGDAPRPEEEAPAPAIPADEAPSRAEALDTTVKENAPAKPAKKPARRPTVWEDDPQLETRFFRLLETGASIRDSAISAGCSNEAVMKRMRRDKKFQARVEKTRCDFKTSSLAIIARAATEHWTAAAWYLERRFPEEFGRRFITRDGGGPVADTSGDAPATGVRLVITSKPIPPATLITAAVAEGDDAGE